MKNQGRRGFLKGGLAGLAGGLLLGPDVKATPSSGELGEYGDVLRAESIGQETPKGDWAATEDNILGPFYRSGAPFRAKVTPPREPGTVLLIRGRLLGLDTRKPLKNGVIDVWQANRKGRYDNDDPKNPPRKGVFVNRARMIADENGAYEYETIHPGAYQIGPNRWRPSHIHYRVRFPGYESLTTQLYFKGDPRNAKDRFIKESLIIDLKEMKTSEGDVYKLGTFDVVLARAGK